MLWGAQSWLMASCIGNLFKIYCAGLIMTIIQSNWFSSYTAFLCNLFSLNLIKAHWARGKIDRLNSNPGVLARATSTYFLFALFFNYNAHPENSTENGEHNFSGPCIIVNPACPEQTNKILFYGYCQSSVRHNFQIPEHVRTQGLHLIVRKICNPGD